MTDESSGPLVPGWLSADEEAAQPSPPGPSVADQAPRKTTPAQPVEGAKAAKSPTPRNTASHAKEPHPKALPTKPPQARQANTAPRPSTRSISPDPDALSWRQRQAVAALLLVGIAIVAAAAGVLSALQPTDEAGSSSVLVATQTDSDTARAEAAEQLRLAVEQFEALPELPERRGGHRNSGRGWLNLSNTETYGPSSIADVLVEAGLLAPERIPDLSDVLLHQCGDTLAVVTTSAVQTPPSVVEWWQRNSCDFVEQAFDQNLPLFISLSPDAS